MGLNIDCRLRNIYYYTCVGYITSFTEADEVSKCYQVNGENYCFYTYGADLSWNEAKEFCERRNSTLPIITDEDIDNVFQQFIVTDSYSVIRNRHVWIGAHARHVNESVNWHWINGQQSGNKQTKAIIGYVFLLMFNNYYVSILYTLFTARCCV